MSEFVVGQFARFGATPSQPEPTIDGIFATNFGDVDVEYSFCTEHDS